MKYVERYFNEAGIRKLVRTGHYLSAQLLIKKQLKESNPRSHAHQQAIGMDKILEVLIRRKRVEDLAPEMLRLLKELCFRANLLPEDEWLESAITDLVTRAEES